MTSPISSAITAKVRALLNKTVANGASEHEAAAAAAKARDIMDRYRLTLTDIEVKAEAIVQETIDRPHQLRVSPADYCLRGISALCGVKFWYMKSANSRRLAIFGQKPDIEMAKYLYEMISGVITVEELRWERTAEYQMLQGSSRRSAPASFRIGMASRLNERLIKMARDLEPVAKTASGTALVLVKNAAVEEAYAALNLNLKGKALGGSARDSTGYFAGKKAAERVNLSRPINHQGALLLK